MKHFNEDTLGPLSPSDEPRSSGNRSMTLADILNERQLSQLEVILKSNPDPDDALIAMKQYFGSIRRKLAAKGVDAGYLAYLLYAKLTGAI